VFDVSHYVEPETETESEIVIGTRSGI
jgi:hypothetical protein